MTDCYKTDKEALKEAQEKTNKYNNLINKINEDIKKYKTLAELTDFEDYKLAYNMLADYLEELKEEVKNGK